MATRHGWRALAACLAVLVAVPAVAGDRPFLATSGAAAEEDDDAVWSIESWFQRTGRAHGLSVAPEYAFDPTTSLQFEFSRTRDRITGEAVREAEVEFKHLFNHIARDGYGWGVVLALGFERAAGSGWRRGALGVKLPFTLSLWEGDGALHLNAGMIKSADTRREGLWSAAIERVVARRTTLFAEAAHEGGNTLWHSGVRWWVRKEKFAIDFGALRLRTAGSRETGVVLGLGWYDL